MIESKHDIYKIDNYLIKIGLVIFAFSMLLLIGFITEYNKDPNLEENIPPLVFLVFFIIGSLSLLIIGYIVRKKEQTVSIVLTKLRQTIEVSVTDLSVQTGISRIKILNSLKIINRRLPDFYIWNQKIDTIADGRLKRTVALVEKCSSCGNTIGKEYPVAADQLPECPYCSTLLSSEEWNRVKSDSIKTIKEEDLHSINNRYAHAAKDKSFSWPVFIFLFIFFWPGAIIYLLAKQLNYGVKQIKG